MSDKTGIEWTDATWPVVQGCDIESPGCSHCYVPPLLWRLSHNPNQTIAAPLAGLVEMTKGGAQFTGKLALREDRLDWPRRWREPRMIFVPSHGDLFHPDVPDSFLHRVIGVMIAERRHTFQVPTKRPARMLEYIRRFRPDGQGRITPDGQGGLEVPVSGNDLHWPPSNIWLGASVEDQRRADERREPMRHLAELGWLTWVSYEPALTAVDWTGWEFLRWLVSGGESGKKARPSHPDWHRATRDWCKQNGIAYFFKQWGTWTPEGISGTMRFMRPDGSYGGFYEAGCAPLFRAGKKAAGRLLDGREHNEFPRNIDAREAA